VRIEVTIHQRETYIQFRKNTAEHPRSISMDHHISSSASDCSQTVSGNDVEQPPQTPTCCQEATEREKVAAQLEREMNANLRMYKRRHLMEIRYIQAIYQSAIDACDDPTNPFNPWKIHLAVHRSKEIVLGSVQVNVDDDAFKCIATEKNCGLFPLHPGYAKPRLPPDQMSMGLERNVEQLPDWLLQAHTTCHLEFPESMLPDSPAASSMTSLVPTAALANSSSTILCPPSRVDTPGHESDSTHRRPSNANSLDPPLASVEPPSIPLFALLAGEQGSAQPTRIPSRLTPSSIPGTTTFNNTNHLAAPLVSITSPSVSTEVHRSDPESAQVLHQEKEVTQINQATQTSPRKGCIPMVKKEKVIRSEPVLKSSIVTRAKSRKVPHGDSVVTIKTRRITKGRAPGFYRQLLAGNQSGDEDIKPIVKCKSRKSK
jgi:hypothetical protein